MTLDKPGARCEMYESENTFVQTLFSRLHVATVPSSPVDHMSPELQHLNYTSEPSQILKSCKTHLKKYVFSMESKAPAVGHDTPHTLSELLSGEFRAATTYYYAATDNQRTDRPLFILHYSTYFAARLSQLRHTTTHADCLLSQRKSKQEGPLCSGGKINK